jgi:hypothetical protein
MICVADENPMPRDEDALDAEEQVHGVVHHHLTTFPAAPAIKPTRGLSRRYRTLWRRVDRDPHCGVLRCRRHGAVDAEERARIRYQSGIRSGPRFPHEGGADDERQNQKTPELPGVRIGTTIAARRTKTRAPKSESRAISYRLK